MGDACCTEGEWAGFWHTPGLEGRISTEDGGSYHYSTDMNAAWRLVEHMLDTKGIQVKLTPIGYNGGWQCSRIDPGGSAIGQANTAPEAICKMFLRAFQVDY